MDVSDEQFGSGGVVFKALDSELATTAPLPAPMLLPCFVLQVVAVRGKFRRQQARTSA